MRVFVLNAGRSGSKTFAESCQFIANFTAGHETRAHLHGEARFEYPDQHIEIDNRLSWFLGPLEQRLRSDDYFVWLRREPEAVARSFVKRWNYSFRGGIIEAFAHALIMHSDEWPDERKLDVCRYYVTTVEANIGLFLRDRPHLVVRLETADRDFERFWRAIGAEGDKPAALETWATRFNASA